MKIRHLRQIRRGQDIRIEDPERGFGFDPRPVSPQRPGTAEQGRFFKEPHSYADVALGEKVPNHLRLRMKIHKDLIDTVPPAYFQPDSEKRNSPNWHETLGDPVRERTQSRSMAGR